MANSQVQNRTAKLTYAFATDGGAVGTITPAITDMIPAGAIIKRAIVEGNTATDAAGAATIAITGGGVTLIGAQSITNMVVGGTAVTDTLRAGAIVTSLGYIPIKATSSAPLKVVIASAALTGGGFSVYIDYTIVP